MSIFPKAIKKGKDKFVTLHMHLENNGKNDISGDIVFVIVTPNGKKEIIKEHVTLHGLVKINKYYRYTVSNNAILGRYYVDGRFYFNGTEVRSETHKNDFFDVLKR